MKIVKRDSSTSPRQGGFAANPIVAALRKLISARAFRKTRTASGVGLAASSMLRFETLEPRLLLSAELLPLASQVPGSDLPAQVLCFVAPAPQIDLNGGASALASTTIDDMIAVALLPPEGSPAGAAIVSAPDLGPSVATVGSTESHVIAFVDAVLHDYQTLVAAISSGGNGVAGDGEGSGTTEVFVLDPARNAFQQITDALVGKSGVSAIHIFSHGFDGGVDLGTDRIDVAALDAHSAQLAGWGRALTPDGDILIYGCDAGFGQQGDRFLARMADLTGADVAASTDTTGSSLLGGNWQLEKSSGPIEASLPASESSLNRYPSLLGSRTWDGGGDGVSWSDRFNWSGDLTPGVNDDVIIDAAAGDPTINISAAAGLVQVKSLTTSRPISVLSGATLQVTTSIVLNRSLTLAGGTIQGGTVSATGSAKLVATNLGGTLADVTLQGDAAQSEPTLLDVSGGYGVKVGVSGDLTLANATLLLQNYGQLNFSSAAATLAGSGTVLFGDNNSYNSLRETASGGQLTIASGITVKGAGGTIGYNAGWGGPANVALVNQGSIGPDRVGTVLLAGASFTNQGTLQASGGGTLNLLATAWSNSGLISETDSTLNLGSSFSTADLGNYSRSGGNINLTGTLNNSGSTLALDDATGSWNLAGGTIQGGTVSATGSAKLVATNLGGTLADVTLQGDAAQSEPTLLDVSGGYGVKVGVSGDLTLANATLLLQNYGQLNFSSPAATLAGSGTVLFGDNNSYNSLRETASGGQLTIASGITVRGAGGTIGYNAGWGGPANVALVNQGSIGPDRAGTVVLAGASFTNQGTLQASGGGTLNLLATAWSNSGLISETDSTLNLGSSFSTADLGNYSRSGGTINLTGTLNNSGSTLALDDATGSWNLAGGTIQGGTVSATGSAKLVATNLGGTLADVTLQGDAAQSAPTLLDVSGGYGVKVGVSGDLTLANATLLLQNYGQLNFSSAAATLAGSGTVLFGDNNSYNSLRQTASGGQLTIASGISVRGAGGTIGYNVGWGGPANVALVNQGSIGPDRAGTVVLAGASFTNQGTLQASGGGTLNLLATAWSNSGLISETDSTLNLGSSFSTADLGNYSRSGGTINLTGTLNNSGSTLALDDATGSWNLAGGTIQGGTVSATGSAKLVATNLGGTLADVTLQGDAAQSEPTLLDVSGGYGVKVGVSGDLTLANATLLLQNYGQLNFSSAAATLAGSGTVLFGDNNSYNSLRETASGGQLTIASGITVRGAGGTIGYNAGWGGPANVALVNQGSIGPDRAGTVVLAGASFTNQGTLQASGGGTLNVQPSSWNNAAGAQITASGSTLTLGGSYANGGSINASNSTVNLEGSLTLAQLGSFDRSGGTVNLKGTLNNSGSTLALDDATGSWNLAGGTIQGGTVSATGSAKLVATNLGGTLADVTLQGDAAQSEPTLLDVSGGYGVKVGVSGDLTLANATLLLQNYGQLNFSSAAATLAGSGTVLFGDNNSYNSLRETASGGQLTIASGITVKGAGGTIGYSAGWGGPANVALVNQGSIGPDRVGTVLLAGASFTNQGTLQASGGGTLNVQPSSWNNAAGAQITASGSTLTLGGLLRQRRLDQCQQLDGQPRGQPDAGPTRELRPQRRHGESEGHSGQHRRHAGAGRRDRFLEPCGRHDPGRHGQRHWGCEAGGDQPGRHSDGCDPAGRRGAERTDAA
jgi:urease beta subunit